MNSDSDSDDYEMEVDYSEEESGSQYESEAGTETTETSGGNSVSEVGGAKLHEFPTTLHCFARFTIVYCFTKTTLGQHIEDAIQHATR